jgi:hypothetical protein
MSSDSVTCTIGKDGKKYYFKNGVRVAVSGLKTAQKSGCKDKSSSCTVGKDGKKYYFKDGNRVPNRTGKKTSGTCKRKVSPVKAQKKPSPKPGIGRGTKIQPVKEPAPPKPRKVVREKPAKKPKVPRVRKVRIPAYPEAYKTKPLPRPPMPPATPSLAALSGIGHYESSEKRKEPWRVWVMYDFTYPYEPSAVWRLVTLGGAAESATKALPGEFVGSASEDQVMDQDFINYMRNTAQSKSLVYTDVITHGKLVKFNKASQDWDGKPAKWAEFIKMYESDIEPKLHALTY